MVDYVEQITREAPDIEARRLGLLDSALGLSRQPVGGFQYDSAGAPVMENVIDPTTGLPQLDADGNPIQRPVRAGLPGQDIVGLSPQQQQAIQLGGAGIGAFEPYLANAQTQQTAGLSTLGQAAQQFTAPTDANISQFMNPFQDSIRDEINRSYDIAEQGAAAQAIQSGAFGGSREGVQRAELDRNRATALARAQADSFLNAQQRQLQGAQGLANLAPQYGAFAGQQAQLGATGQQLAGQDINTLLGLGQLGQQFGVTDPTTGAFTPGQAQVEAQRQNTLQNLYEPYQRVGFLSDIYAGAPSSTQTITSSTGPAAPPPISPLRQIAGYAGLGLGALSGLSGLQGLF